MYGKLFGKLNFLANTGGFSYPPYLYGLQAGLLNCPVIYANSI